MEAIDFSPLKESLNNIAFQLIVFLLICTAAYVVTYLVLRLIKIPKPIANFLSTAVLLVTAYYSFVNGYIPGIQGAQ
ncbi:hypothetical protein [Metabacillus fastidiosus]|uniref:hypothetical protein n=1 Tax=Metabacillus fastidiosus TaxID=1458 RepID=UPI003D2B85CC